MQNLKLNPNPEFDLSKVTEEEKDRLLLRWRNDPVLYFVERLGIHSSIGEDFKEGDQLDVHEKEVLRALPVCIAQRRALVLPSANGMGKDWTISGRASLWFYECFAPCKVIMTGPTERQVTDIMWNELKFAYHNRPSKDEMGRLVSLKLDGAEDWFITAFTTKETEGKEGKFQGVHAARLMIIVSEAQAVDKKIYEQIEGLRMAGICLVCYLGNPLMDNGPFITETEDTEKNLVIRLDAYDCINVKAKRQVLPGLVSYEWVMEREKLWNADGSGKDPRYMARVRGLVPISSINSIISRELYLRCIHRELTWWSAYFGTMGVDPALTGTDDMVISIFKSGILIDEVVIPYNENEVVAAGKIQIKLSEHFPAGGACIVIDSDGLGIKVANAFEKMMPKDTTNKNVLIKYRGSCNDRDIVDPQYENIRAEAHFYAKQRMMDGHISLDDNDYAKQEATSVLQFTNTRGRIQIEDKDDLKGRIGRSPNRWDARVCGIWGFKFAKQIQKKDAWGKSRTGGRDSIYVPGGSAMSA